jgi:hypothetical protein
MTPYSLNIQYFELHNVKFEQTDVVQYSISYRG